MKQSIPLTADEQATVDLLPSLNLSNLARVIRKNWRPVYFGAVPYLDALSSMDKIEDPYYADSGKSVVLYFLCNAQTWKGPIARAVKAELNKRAKACKN